MAEPVVDAVAVASRDLARSIAFYGRLGFRFPRLGPGDRHVEAERSAGGARLMIDDATLLESLWGAPPRPGNHAGFAVRMAGPPEVDEAVAALKAAGDKVETEAFDAPWGQRYAVVRDPDGYAVDLFAPLSG
jgi:catechol 2,3-dioxygenase-like lactoylglutathione lyase family enzyme